MTNLIKKVNDGVSDLWLLENTVKSSASYNVILLFYSLFFLSKNSFVSITSTISEHNTVHTLSGNTAYNTLLTELKHHQYDKHINFYTI